MNVFSIIKLVVIILAAAIFITASLSLMTSSYAEWAEYYNNAMAEKESQKYFESLPLTFEGVTIKMADAPLVEGAVAAAVTASMGMDLDTVLDAAKDAYEVNKL